MNIIEERTVALAGILQACEQVQALARTGKADEAARQASLKSILVLDAVNTPAVFGGVNGVHNGLRLLANGILVDPHGNDIEILRYTMSLLNLQSQLFKDSEKFSQFGSDVENLSGVESEQLTRACSDVYQRYISKLQPQIIVQGEEEYLQIPDVQEGVRSLLLAGIRAAVLWQQKGGGRFKLMWERTRMRNAATALMARTSVH